MNVKLTEKEAKEIFAQRYLDSLGKKRYLPLVLYGISLIFFLTLYAPGREWLIVGLAAIPAIIAGYLAFRFGRKARIFYVQQMMVE